MAVSSVIRNAGVTTAMSVGATSTAAVQIVSNTNDHVNYVQLLNTGSNPVAVKFGDANVGAAVFPVSGTGDYVLAAGMTQPVIVACPAAPFYIRAIGSAAGPAIIYVTPTGDQS